MTDLKNLKTHLLFIFYKQINLIRFKFIYNFVNLFLCFMKHKDDNNAIIYTMYKMCTLKTHFFTENV